MKKMVKVPAVGESITEVTINEWKIKTGDWVDRDQIVLVIDSDKASLEVAADSSGVIAIQKNAGETVPVGSVVALIDEDAKRPEGVVAKASAIPASSKESAAATAASVVHAPQDTRLMPSAARLAAETKIDTTQIEGTGKGGRVTKADVIAGPSVKTGTRPKTTTERETRTAMTQLRKRAATRLVMAQQTAAILTTFNEIDMSNVMDLRAKYKDSFEKKHGVRLGFMSFFSRAVIEALHHYPIINSYVDGTDIVQRNYFDISVAVQGPKGLVVPVMRDVDQMTLADVEKTIKLYGDKAKAGTLSIDEMTGGGFTISNGGVFGSLMSTPILNPPQSGILGLHKIQDRPVAVNGQVVIRPMMYVALSYDHRIIDGAQSVGFLVKVKEFMENPGMILLDL